MANKPQKVLGRNAKTVKKIAEEPPVTRGASDIDGFERTEAEERDLNALYARFLRGSTGRDALKYLRSISIDFIAGPEVSSEHLRHLEGSRYIVAVMEKRAERGRKL
jgi:hypothetical protein